MRVATFRRMTVGLMLTPGIPAFGDSDGNQGVAGLRFSGSLTGAQEPPAVATDATGKATGRFDPGFTRVKVRIPLAGDVQGLAGLYHCGRAGVDGPVAFGLMNPGPLGEIVDRSRLTLINADFMGADCMAATGRPINNVAALVLGKRDGLVYLNLHSPSAPGGQIRARMIESE